jgi:hypothetical protein
MIPMTRPAPLASILGHDQRPEVLGDRLVRQPVAALAPLVIDLPAFFESVLDD